MSKETMIDILAEQGISYSPQPTTTEVAGRTISITSTNDPQLDIFDLASDLVDGNVSNAVAVAKLMHVSKLLVDKLEMRGEYEECLAALQARTAWRAIDAGVK